MESASPSVDGDEEPFPSVFHPEELDGVTPSTDSCESIESALECPDSKFHLTVSSIVVSREIIVTKLFFPKGKRKSKLRSLTDVKKYCREKPILTSSSRY